MIDWLLDHIQTISLIMIGVIYIAYIAKALMLRMDGIRVNLLGKGDKPANDRIAEIVLQAVTLIGAAVQFVSAAFPYFIPPLEFIPAVRIAGIILLLFADVVFIAAIITMRNSWRAGFSYDQRTRLITEGIYSFSRNPAFLGFDMLYIGCAMVFPNVLSIGTALVAIILFHVQILGEERYLFEVFGQRYTNYKSHVRRYF